VYAISEKKQNKMATQQIGFSALYPTTRVARTFVSQVTDLECAYCGEEIPGGSVREICPRCRAERRADEGPTDEHQRFYLDCVLGFPYLGFAHMTSAQAEAFIRKHGRKQRAAS